MFECDDVEDYEPSIMIIMINVRLLTALTNLIIHVHLLNFLIFSIIYSS
jgi:hypothetical protein